MLDHRIYNEINSDLRHTSADFLELCYRLKGKDKLCIIADGGVMSGMPVGEYNLPERGKYTVGADYLLRDSRGIFDGSTKHILFGMQNWVSVIGIPMEEAVVMAALNPAKVLKIDHQKGSIKEHKDADFTVINENFDVLATYVEGNKVYDRYDGVQYENQEYLNYRCQ
ncbi:N-acetylgalactosamine-6-phosphate deacetylase [bioreactor metagenome]|uniref:N-acetylgalactosamine-6-phosphate deacetylase n=1 Tax=bioreactor metagenome TaxID=1076179 RepID=A0A645B0J2_9ZZZZ